MSDLDDLDEALGLDLPPPAGAATPFSLILYYSPEMVAELAMGADDPLDIAERYGVSEDDYEHLAAQGWFNALVAQKRHEFHDSGMLFVAKAGMMAEALLTRLFQQSMAGSIAAPLTVEVAKQLTDIGRLKPQPLSMQPGAAGGGFSINIQVNGADVVRHDSPLVAAPIDVTPSIPIPSPAAPTVSSTVSGDSAAVAPRAAPPDTWALPDKAAAKLADKPAYISNLRVPDFDLRRPGVSALTGYGASPDAAVQGTGLPTATRSL